MRRTLTVVAAGVLAAFALSGCGAVDLTTDKPEANNAAAPTSQPSGNAANLGNNSGNQGAQGGGAGLALSAVDTSVGRVVTDAKGWVLYRFDRDAPKPSKATCYDDCAKKWPAVPYSDDYQVTGVARSALGKVTRTDGTDQLTINGWPVYRFAGDTRPGEVKGHGAGDVWFAVAPDGKKASAPVKSDY